MKSKFKEKLRLQAISPYLLRFTHSLIASSAHISIHSPLLSTSHVSPHTCKNLT